MILYTKEVSINTGKKMKQKKYLIFILSDLWALEPNKNNHVGTRKQSF